MGFIKSALMSECPNGFTPNSDYDRGKVLQDVISAKVERDLWGKFTLSLTLAKTADNRQRAAYDAGFFTCYDRPWAFTRRYSSRRRLRRGEMC